MKQSRTSERLSDFVEANAKYGAVAGAVIGLVLMVLYIVQTGASVGAFVGVPFAVGIFAWVGYVVAGMGGLALVGAFCRRGRR